LILLGQKIVPKLCAWRRSAVRPARVRLWDSNPFSAGSFTMVRAAATLAILWFSCGRS